MPFAFLLLGGLLGRVNSGLLEPACCSLVNVSNMPSPIFNGVYWQTSNGSFVHHGGVELLSEYSLLPVAASYIYECGGDWVISHISEGENSRDAEGKCIQAHARAPAASGCPTDVMWQTQNQSSQEQLDSSYDSSYDPVTVDSAFTVACTSPSACCSTVTLTGNSFAAGDYEAVPGSQPLMYAPALGSSDAPLVPTFRLTSCFGEWYITDPNLPASLVPPRDASCVDHRYAGPMVSLMASSHGALCPSDVSTWVVTEAPLNDKGHKLVDSAVRCAAPSSPQTKKSNPLISWPVELWLAFVALLLIGLVLAVLLIALASGMHLRCCNRATVDETLSKRERDGHLELMAQVQVESQLSHVRLGDASAGASQPTDLTTLLLVPVAKLAERLAVSSAEEVLQILHETDDFLHRVDLSSSQLRIEPFALISYRQERRECDGFTIDGAALRAIVRTALEQGVENLWLDAWCYEFRFQESYDHELFCQTLSLVAHKMSVVLWLPRSRNDVQLGSYQERLWCTFESVAIAERNLIVHCTGEGLSHGQRLLLTWGPFLPYVPGHVPAELRELACFNSLSALAFVMSLVLLGLWIAFSAHNLRSLPHWSAAMEISTAYQALIYVFFVAGVATQYYIATKQFNALGLQRSRARNAQRVLQTMRRAPEQRPMASLSMLMAELPWLSAFDRRDVIVIQRVLTELRGGNVRRSTARVLALPVAEETLDRCSLALAAFVSAKLVCGPGDAVANHTLESWLGEKGIVLPMRQAVWLNGVVGPDDHGGELPLSSLRPWQMRVRHKLGHSELHTPCGALRLQCAPHASGRGCACMMAGGLIPIRNVSYVHWILLVILVCLLSVILGTWALHIQLDTFCKNLGVNAIVETATLTIVFGISSALILCDLARITCATETSDAGLTGDDHANVFGVVRSAIVGCIGFGFVLIVSTNLQTRAGMKLIIDECPAQANSFRIAVDFTAWTCVVFTWAFLARVILCAATTLQLSARSRFRAVWGDWEHKDGSMLC